MPRSVFVGLKNDRQGCGVDDYAAPFITVPSFEDSDSVISSPVSSEDSLVASSEVSPDSSVEESLSLVSSPEVSSPASSSDVSSPASSSDVSSPASSSDVSSPASSPVSSPVAEPASFVNYGSPTAVWQARDLAAGALTVWPDAVGVNDATLSAGTGSKSDTGFLGTHGVTVSGSIAMTLASTITPGTGAFTIIAFANTSSDSSIMGHNASNVQTRRDRSGANNFSLFGGFERFTVAAPVDHDIPQMMIWEYDGAGICRFQCNKTEVALSSANGSPGSMTFNRLFRTSFGNFWTGEAGDIGIWAGSALGKTLCDQIYDDFKADIYPALP